MLSAVHMVQSFSCVHLWSRVLQFSYLHNIVGKKQGKWWVSMYIAHTTGCRTVDSLKIGELVSEFSVLNIKFLSLRLTDLPLFDSRIYLVDYIHSCVAFSNLLTLCTTGIRELRSDRNRRPERNTWRVASLMCFMANDPSQSVHCKGWCFQLL